MRRRPREFPKCYPVLHFPEVSEEVGAWDKLAVFVLLILQHTTSQNYYLPELNDLHHTHTPLDR
jgi:hypothetical protein